VGQHVEAPAVRHADHGLARGLVGGQVQCPVQDGHQHVEPLDAEALMTEVVAVEKALQPVHVRQLGEQRLLVLFGERVPVLPGLDHAPQPHALLVARDVLDLVGDRAAVDLPQAGEHVL
jgi:hypothetical protein